MAEDNTIIPAYTDAGDRSLVTIPFFWVGGFLSMAGALWKGATVICEDDHSPGALLRTMRREKATHLTGGEVILRSVQESPDYQTGDFDRLKPQTLFQVPMLGGDPSIDRNSLPGSLGMTETFGPHSGEPAAGRLTPEAVGSLGHALGEMEFKIVDPHTGERQTPPASGEPRCPGPPLFRRSLRRHD